MFLGKPEDPKTFPIIVVANKLDMYSKRKITHDQIRKFCYDNRIYDYYDASVKVDMHLGTIFEAVARALLGEPGPLMGAHLQLEKFPNKKQGEIIDRQNRFFQ